MKTTTSLQTLGAFAVGSAALLVGLLSTNAAPPRAVPGPPRYVEGELLVKFRGGPRGQAAEHARGLLKHEVKRNFDLIGWQHIRLTRGMTVEEALAKYRSLPNVLAVEPNGITELDSISDPLPNANVAAAAPIPNDPMFSSQWNLRLLGMTNAWTITPGNSEVVVAVLDTGIDYTHQDLHDNMWRNPGETGVDDQARDKATNGVDDDGNGYVDDVFGIDTVDQDSDPMDLGDGQPFATGRFHGTACAGIIGATGNNGIGMAGVNWSVRMIAVRVGNTNNQIFFSRHLEGVEYILRLKQGGINIRASNHSYGGGGIGFSQAHYDAGLSLQEAGVLIVHSAGNGTLDKDRLSRWPIGLDLPLLMAIAATDSSDALASYSDFGRSTVDLAAPGSNPLTTQPANRYFTDYSGTSFAAPHVAGAAALLASARPDATAWQLKAALMHSVDQRPSLTNKIITHGRLNVGRAMELLTNDATPPIVVAATPSSSKTRLEQVVEVWFSRPMDRTSVEAAFEINPPSMGSFEWSIDSSSFKFVGSAPFQWTNHTARIRASAMSATGLTLDGNFDRIAAGSSADDFVWTFGFPPRNDDFANASSLENHTGSMTGTTYNAVWQFGEPFSPSFKKTNWVVPGSLWYRWTADYDGWITFETTGTFIDTLLSAYTGGALDALTEVASSDDDGSRAQSRVSFPATAGTTYSIVVRTQHETDFTAAMGPFTLRWYPTPPPVITSVGSSAFSGQRINISGTNFTGVTSVLFNGVEAAFVINTNASYVDLSLTVTVPEGATTGPITIETPHGTFTTTNNFTVLVRPLMAVRPVPGTNLIEISWVSTSGFLPQRADNLAPGAAWSSAPWVSTRLTNGIRIVTVRVEPGQRFFRLYRQ